METGRHLYGGARQVLWLARDLAGAGVENLLISPPGSDVAAAAAEYGVPVREIACAGDHDLLFALRLSRLLRRWRPDLVHCHSRRGGDILGGIASRMAAVPAVLSRRVDNPESSLSRWLRYRWFLKVVAISDNVGAVLRAQGLPEDRIEVIRDAVEVGDADSGHGRAALRDGLGIAEAHFAVAVVAQLIPRKGHRLLLDALPGIVESCPGVRVFFFGQGPEEADLRQYAKDLGVAAKVDFAGFRQDLTGLLPAFDLLVHPADREGLGVAMLEAAAAGLPVVALDVAGAREAVVNGATGILVPPGNSAMLRQAILTMIENPERRRQYGAAGRARMRDEFSVAGMVERYLDLYGRILDGRH